MTCEQQLNAMLSEAHRLLDVWATREALYYATSKPESDTAMRESLAAQYAASALITARATAMSSKYKSALTILREAIERETNESSRRHLDEALQKIVIEDAANIAA